MSRLKQLSRNALFAWSPKLGGDWSDGGDEVAGKGQQQLWLAAGTSAGHFDASFSSAAALELCRLDLSDGRGEVEPRVSIPSPERFHSLIWSQAEGRRAGLIVGGGESGAIRLWDAGKAMTGGSGAELATLAGHQSHVLSLETNPFKRNLLASGASASEVLVWDLAKAGAQPMAPGPKQQPPDHIVAVRWSPQVEHILASLCTGRAHIWDLRKSEGPILSLGDLGARVQWKAMAWHPESATSLVLASEEDSFPVIQTWDVRFAQAPLAQMDGHQKGILALDWCYADPDLLITAAKDLKLYIWNPNTATFLAELPFSARNWAHQVSWCPSNPSLLGVGSTDSRVGIYSILGGGGDFSVSEGSPQPSPSIAESFPGADFSNLPQPSPVLKSEPRSEGLKLPQVPRWLRPGPCGVRFAFPNRLISFAKPSEDPLAASAQTAPSRTVEVSQLSTEPLLLNRARELEKALAGMEGGLAQLCAARRDASLNSAPERLLWDFLRAHSQGSGRREYSRLLGLGDKSEENLTAVLGHRPHWHLQQNQLAEEDAAKELAASVTKSLSVSGDGKERSSSPLKLSLGVESWEGVVVEALLSSDMEAAAEACIRCGRWADAFQVGMAGGTQLFQRVQSAYLAEKSRSGDSSSSRLVALLTGQRWTELIQSADLSQWAQVLGLLFSYAPSEELVELAAELGERMLESVESRAYAPLATVASGNVEALIKCLKGEKKLSSEELLDVVEKASVLRSSLGKAAETGAEMAAVSADLAAVLANQGALSQAAAFLSALPVQQLGGGEERERDLGLLKDRVLEAAGASGRRPSRPYQISPVGQVQTRTAANLGSAAQWRRGSTPHHPGLSNSQAPVYSAPPQPQYQVPAPPQHQHTYYSNQPAAQYQPPPPPPVAQVAEPPAQAGPPFAPVPPTFHSRGRYPSHSSNESSTPAYNSALHSGPPQPWAQQPQPVQSPYAPPPPQMMTPMTPMGPGAETATTLSGPPVAAVAPRPAASFTPGWNDPPPLSGPSKKKATASTPAPAPPPLTAPVQGGVPAPAPLQHPNHIHHPSQLPGPVGAPPPPMQFNTAMPPVSNAGAYPPHAMMGGGGGGMMDGMSSGRVSPALSAQSVPVSAPAPLPPMPEEDAVIAAALDGLCAKIQASQPSALVRKRIAEAHSKLEAELYTRLRKGSLSATTRGALHQASQALSQGDYDSALGILTSLATSFEFSAVSPFLPSFKATLQTAKQLRI